MKKFAITFDSVQRIFKVICFEARMPSDIVSVVVSTGVGVSVIAGILSGVCYIIAHGVQRKRNKHRRNSLSCPVCGRELQRRPSVDSALSGSGVGRWAACSRCQRRACKGRCAQFRAGEGWVCGECSRPPELTGNAGAGNWIRGIMETLIAPPPMVPQDGIGDRMNAAEDDEKRKKDREEVRDFIERLVNVLLGENVDDASINKLYNDEKYEDLFNRYHQHLSNALTDLGSALQIPVANLPVTGQSPCTAHTALKQIIERLLREAISLPSLNRDSQSLPPNESDRTYEDLLATAIINKVVSNSQHTRPGSSAASLSSRTSTPSRRRGVKEYFFGEETLEDKWKTTDLDTSSASSLEEWIHSDSSFGSKKYVDRVTLTIKQNIEEVPQSESENEDDSEYFRTNSSLLSEEEPNWFLQKRQFQGTHSPVPVPMLVPNPTTEAKVLIGDKEVDETSDLSDVGSDFGEAESVPGRTSLLIESKTVIGGKNFLVDGNSDDESSGDSGVKEVDGSVSGQHTPNRHIAKTDITVDDDNVEDASIMSVYSNTEKVAEYTEKYGSLPRTIVKSPVPTPPARVSLQNSKQHDEIAQQNGTDQTDSIKENGVQDSEEDLKKDIEIFSGRYSKREKEKWKHAVEMKNNPYSPENIEKRMKQSSSTISSLFGPDYYAKLAATPRGGRVDSPEVNELTWTPNKERETEEQEKSMIIEDVFESSTDPGTPTPNASLKSVSLLSPEPKTELEMTSDSDLSVVNCYNIEKSEVSVTPKVRNGTIDNNASASESEIEVVKKDMPKPRERPKYLKLNSALPSRNLRSPFELTSLKRHKSETDLLSEDSFDATPRILGQKKDNTLISRIYQDPHVRSFALSSREQLPVETLNYGRYNGNQVCYNSDDGFPTRTRRKLFSYDDDLLSSNVVRTTNEQFRRARNYSSEGGKSSRQRQHIYSSSEDLLEAQESEKPSQKKDNTIVSKIYQDPNVRNFAMANSERQRLGKKSYSSEEDVFSNKSSPGTPKLSSTRSENTLNGILSRNEETRMTASSVHTPDSDIDELAKKHIVHNILDQISRSRDASQERGPKDGYITDEEINVSVKDLRKLFESNEGTGKVISSLTARSLSKQIREDLKIK